MELVTLDRYERGSRLGTGADYEVRTAVDRETGNQVVLKRPVPQMIKLNQHSGAEGRTQRLLQAHQDIGPDVSGIVPILGYTEPANHDEFFGDSLGHDYRVTVEERAKGVPLLGDQMARITGVPIGVGQNLFALHPLAQPADQAAFPIHQGLLEVERAFLQAGYLLLDLRPQNIFYQPGTGNVTVIDCGALVPLNPDPSSEAGGEIPAGGRAGDPRPDLNDFCLEILKFYTTPQSPPDEAAGYRDPYGLRPVVRFDEEFAELEASFNGSNNGSNGNSSNGDGPIGACGPAALAIINKARGRGYASSIEGLEDFRQDLDRYLETIQARNQDLPGRAQARLAWDEACDWLRADYWRKFLFDPDVELAAFKS